MGFGFADTVFIIIIVIICFQAPRPRLTRCHVMLCPHLMTHLHLGYTTFDVGRGEELSFRKSSVNENADSPIRWVFTADG